MLTILMAKDGCESTLSGFLSSLFARPNYKLPGFVLLH